MGHHPSKIIRAALARAVQNGDWRTAKAFGVTWAERKPVPDGKMAVPGTERFELISGKVWLVSDVIDLPVERRMVRKSTIIARLTDAQLEAAMGMLTVRQQERWRAPDQPAVYFDDPETVAIVTAVGADPAVVLAEGDA